MSREQTFKPSYARELLRIAQGDFETVEVLCSADKGRPENACFMAQQVVEKSIKAVLVSRGQSLPFTHNLEILLDRLEESDLPPESRVIPDLSEYASIRRYEEGIIDLDKKDLQSVRDLARSTLEWAERLLNGAS